MRQNSRFEFLVGEFLKQEGFITKELQKWPISDWICLPGKMANAM